MDSQNGVIVRYIGDRIPVVMEPMENTYAQSFALWLLQGSRDERPDEYGIAHFLEHMFFKGTTRRTALDIARLLDRIGGRVDAFTTKEYVCFYARVLQEHQKVLVDLFSDLVLYPRFDPVEMEKERMVILEEIRGAEDDPGEFASDRFIESLWPGHPVGRPVGGTQQDIMKIQHSRLLEFFKRQVFPENVLITVTGAVKPDETFALLSEAFAPLLERHGQVPERTPPKVARFADAWIWTEMEQVHVLIGGPGLSLTDKRRFAFGLALNVLGSGMSSRLFTRIREEKGLAYNVYASTMPLSDCGMWYVYAATARDRLHELMDALREELNRMGEGTITDEEISLGKEQFRANMLMSWESASDRMFTRAKQFVYREPFISAEERVRRIEAISLDEVNEIAREIFKEDEFSALILGHLDDTIVSRLDWPGPFNLKRRRRQSEDLRPVQR